MLIKQAGRVYDAVQYEGLSAMPAAGEAFSVVAQSSS